MNGIALLLIGVVALTGAITFMTAASGQADEGSSPIYGVKVPANYREWKLIAVDNLLVAGKTDQLRAQLGNDIAIKAFEEGKVPFPDGAIIAAVHWTRIRSEDNSNVPRGSILRCRIPSECSVHGQGFKEVRRNERLGVR